MKLLIFACLVAYVSAHACLVSPEQTGGYPSNALNTQGKTESAQHMSEPLNVTVDYNVIFIDSLIQPIVHGRADLKIIISIIN